jgi:hypothetical protein
MPGLVPGIHAVVRNTVKRKASTIELFLQQQHSFTAWMPGTRPGMTANIHARRP